MSACRRIFAPECSSSQRPIAIIQLFDSVESAFNDLQSSNFCTRFQAFCFIFFLAYNLFAISFYANFFLGPFLGFMYDAAKNCAKRIKSDKMYTTYANVTRPDCCSHPVVSKYVPCDIMVTNWNNCRSVRLDFHQMGNDLPVSGTLVCMQIK